MAEGLLFVVCCLSLSCLYVCSENFLWQKVCCLSLACLYVIHFEYICINKSMPFVFAG